MRKTSKTKQIAEKTIFAAFKILKKAGGAMRGNEVVDKIRETVKFDEYENHRYEKTGYVRWESILHFYTIDCMKAGFLRKQRNVWFLTDEGEEAIPLGAEKLLETATKKYKEWNLKNKSRKKSSFDKDLNAEAAEDKSQVQIALLEQYETDAIQGIREFILAKNPYEFQELVAELLKAMGYHIPFIAPKGKDGGIDIIAYSDELGVTPPRVIVQVKHRPESNVGSPDIQQLRGTMKRSSDIGIFVTSGGFTKPARAEAQGADQHIELIDFERFVELWQMNYLKLTKEGRAKLLLHPIYFLGSSET